MRAARSASNLGKPQTPTLGGPRENIRVVFSEGFRGILRLPIFLDVGHDSRIAEPIHSHVLFLDGVWVWALPVGSKMVLQVLLELSLPQSLAVKIHEADPIIGERTHF